MTQNRALAPIERGTWQTMVEQAATLVKSGFLPAHIKTPEQAVAVMLTGQELGIPAMTALRTVAVIQGKVTLQAELMAALIERDYGANALRVEETDDTACLVSYHKPGWPERKHYTFTIEDAKQAGLGGVNWQKYPAAMLRARCISAVAKMAFQATLGGIYTPEEMDAPVTVTEDGEVVYDPPAPIDDVIDAAPAPTPIAEPTGSGPLHPLGRKRAAEVYRRLTSQTDYSERDIGSWLQYHGFDGVGNLPDITEAEADAMARDAVAGRRPWEEPPTDAVEGELIGDDFDAEDGGDAA